MAVLEEEVLLKHFPPQLLLNNDLNSYKTIRIELGKGGYSLENWCAKNPGCEGW